MSVYSSGISISDGDIHVLSNMVVDGGLSVQSGSLVLSGGLSIVGGDLTVR